MKPEETNKPNPPESGQPEHPKPMSTNDERTANQSDPSLPDIAIQGSPPTVASGIDLASLALPQDFANLAQVKSEVLTVPLNRPGKQVWFAPHPDSSCWMLAAVLKDESEDDNYIVAPALRQELEGEWAAKALVPCVTHQGAYYVWPIKLPDSNGKIDGWNHSALEIAHKYGGKWIRLKSILETRSYDALQPVSPIAPPSWPEDISTILTAAIKGHVIERGDHPVVKRLRGEVL